MKSINPTTNSLITTYTPMSDDCVKEILDKVADRFKAWSGESISARSKLLIKLAEVLQSHKQELAQLTCAEMVKPVDEGIGEAQKCAWVCEYYAECAEQFLAPEPIDYEGADCSTVYQPLGTILAVMPWNFPFWQVFRFAAPNIMAGNTAVLKHAGNVTGCALAIENLFIDAGFPDDVFRTLAITSDQVASVIQNPNIKAVTLTGSTEAGKAVAREAGSNIKKSVLELGGSDAYVVLEDADLDATIDSCVASRLINSGQSCISAKRFIIVDTIYEKFVNRFTAKMASKVMGDPLSDKTDIGPMARQDLRDELHAQVSKSISKGAELKLGGEVPKNDGAFYPPTVLTEVTSGMPAYHEELFGPVAALIRARDEEDAIRIANDSPFGLGGAVFTKNTKRGKEIASHELEAGCCFVNDFVKSDPRLPFGGTKLSGYGRELSKLGIREFVNIKTVYVS